jgi:hypothetical protein
MMRGQNRNSRKCHYSLHDSGRSLTAMEQFTIGSFLLSSKARLLFWAWFPNEGKIWLIIEVEKSHKGLT